MKKLTHIVLFLLLVLITYSSVQNPLSHEYLNSLKPDALDVSANMEEEGSLMSDLKQYAKENDIKPDNARIDPIWKAIPGYNGLSVDVKASYERMKKKKHFDEALLVFHQSSPEVSLSDLPPSPIYKGNPNKPMVTFLINVAWGNEYLPGMLETLKKNKVRTTFFLDGSWVKKNQDMAKVILEEGHEIGNHAYSHPDMQKLSNTRIEEEIQKTNQIIQSTLDVSPHWFAPPSGSYRTDVINIAASLKMNTILWSVDTVDWRNPDPNQMVSRVLSKIHPGAMVLMHPTKATSRGLDQMIKGVQEKGYSIGTVSQLMNEKRVMKSTNKPDFDK